MPATSFSEMPTLASSSTSPAPQPFHRRRKSWARKIERCCWTTFSHFPLVFVYGLTTWAVWVHVTVSLLSAPRWYSYAQAALGVIFYSLANLSYTIAVFNGAGSPLDPKQDLSKRRKTGGYEGLPTYEHEEDGNDEAVPREWMTTVTAKSTGRPRYCKKCRVVKPDRTHHCSTCGRCVLKMDHHCPWLATCVGLRNYKPFLLFLIYTCLFCWLCFAVSAYWVWVELTNSVQMTEGLRVINTLLLTMLSGIIGLVLSGFTAWHLYLTVSGQTTIESLEKTRYLSPLRKQLQTQSQAGRNPLGQSQPLFSGLSNSDDQPLAERLKEIHANALPGVVRPEEGEITLDSAHHHHPSQIPSPDSQNMTSAATNSLQRSYASMEAQRERDRYNMYLDEQDSEKLPNAFNLGWRRNLLHVFGPQPLLWPLPVCNTTGDGWHWDVSPAWVEARDRVGREREQHERQQQQQQAGFRDPQPPFEPPSQRRPPEWKWNAGAGFVDHGHATPPLPPSLSGPPIHARSPAHGHASVQMQSLDRRKAGSGTEDLGHQDITDTNARIEGRGQQRQDASENWNDVPDDFLAPRNGASHRSHSQGRRKGD